MVVFMVVPVEQLPGASPAVLDRTKPFWKLRPVLDCLELGFRERVVIGNMRSGVRLGNSKVGQQQRHGLRLHRRPSVGMNRQLIAPDVLFVVRLGDQPLGQAGGFTFGHHPADHIAAVDVEDHVEIVIAPFPGALQLRDVPTPDFVGPGGQQFRFLIIGDVEALRRSRTS